MQLFIKKNQRIPILQAHQKGKINKLQLEN